MAVYRATSSTKGDVVIFTPNAPYVINDTLIPLEQTTSGNIRYDNVSELIARFPAFDNAITIFVTSESAKTTLENKGFSQVYLVERNEVITFANGAHIDVSSSLGMLFRDVNNTVSRSIGSLESMPAVPSNNWCAEGAVKNYVIQSQSSYTYTGAGSGFLKISTSYNYAISLQGWNDGSGAKYWLYQISLADSVINSLNTIYDGLTPDIGGDPYEPGGTSETGGGTGTFDLTSDNIDFPSLPTLTAVSTGLVSIYTPTLTQLNSLANFLWNANPTDVDWWKKLVANPLDLILGLSIVPVSVPAGASQNIKVGLIDTGVAMTKAATQFVTVDCGSINVAEVWGSALDYSPFTKFSIYLPFIGTRTINTDDIMGKTVQVKYNVDLLSGACTAMVKCGSSVLYQYSGACAISLPLTGETFTSMITSTIQLAASLGATVASGGAAAGVTAASAANSVVSMKPQIERAGGVSGAAGQLGIMTPYLIAEVPRQSVPARYNTFAGYPSNINAVLGDLTGYTEIETIYIKGISATKTELDEIETLLKAGVII